MDNKSNYFEDLKVIKKAMEESSRFLSLSGLSGLFAGIIALIGAVIAVFSFLNGRFLLDEGYFKSLSSQEIDVLKIKLITDAALVLIFAIGVSLFFSYRKSLRKGIKIWTPISKRLLTSFLVPLAAGGVFILILYLQNFWMLIIPSMLIFYGLALVNAGKFTYSEIFYLGLIEILSGLFSMVLPAYGILIWCFGFGLLHIAYGLIMYRKYEG
jgi:hypothetical protein